MRATPPKSQARAMRPGMIAVAAISVTVALVGDHPLVDATIVAGLGLVAPLSLGSPRRWALVAFAAAIGLSLDAGPVASTLMAPALIVASWSIVDRLRKAGVRDVRSLFGLMRSLDSAVFVLVPVWALVGAVSLLASEAEVEILGIGEPIVRLTAVHYLYAGVGALTIALRLRNENVHGAQLPLIAVIATAAAPPVVALGFVLGHPVPQIGGALLMTVGVWSAAAVLLAGVRRTAGSSLRVIRMVAGLTPWVPMVLAVAWATAQHVAGTPALSVPDMARIHGLANGIGFVLLGLLATSVPRTPAIRPHVGASG